MTHESSATLVDQQSMPAPADRVAAPLHDQDTFWDYTLLGHEVAALRQQNERKAGRSERHSIGRDTRLAEGVYEGSYGGEAITIDYRKNPQLIDAAVSDVMAAARDPQTGRVRKDQIMRSVFNRVSDTMQYDAVAVAKIFEDELGGKEGKKISLNSYIERGVGVCRHQALFAGVILERLKDEGVIGGTASVDRNMVRSGPDGEYDGHAWVRYTNSGGDVFILDIAHKKLMSLEDAMAQHAKDPAGTWDYARPEDKHAARNRKVGRHSLRVS
jgi:hypothetical protein